MPKELARRGDLALVRSSNTERAGLYRGEGEDLRPAGSLDRWEWKWVLVGAGPLALRSFGPEPDARGGSGPLRGESVQTTPDVEAAKIERCACGHEMARCGPENCSHPFARAAVWGDGV